MRDFALIGLLFLTACAGTDPRPREENPDLTGWRDETIELPSEFAPTLPKGSETLKFAPGMFTAEADDYWSYVFVVVFPDLEPGDLDVKSFLDEYYTGLIEAVAKQRGIALNRPAAIVKLDPKSESHWLASIDLVDAFVTGRPVTVNLEIDLEAAGAGSRLEVVASPKAYEDALWGKLRGVLDGL